MTIVTGNFLSTTPGDRLVRRDRCLTSIQAAVKSVAEVRRSEVIAIEQGPPADLPCSGLSEQGETVIVCDPDRNHPMARDSEYDDAIDAEQLLKLTRSGFSKAVHRPESSDSRTSTAKRSNAS